jgi:hypothetical protein
MLISMGRLATNAKHAKVTHAINDITSCHDIQSSQHDPRTLISTTHIVSCLRLMLREQASPISEGVMEIRINSHLAREIT